MRDLAAFLARGRAAHQDLMSDQIQLYRPGQPVFDRDTGTTIPGPPTVFYTGPARVRPTQTTGEEQQAGERDITLREYEVALPWDTPLPDGARVVPGDEIKVTGSEDPRMPGLVLYVTGAQYSGDATAWRIYGEDRS
ncbi:DUF6093 family protein [Streptomyces sp. NPDC006997]|uniref:DUF6093 family protein n=1 Tax=Streptomyces sp. NPDC006997 TaxID=3155356 RepID=UPI0033CEEF59